MFSQAVKVAITGSPSFSRHAATPLQRPGELAHRLLILPLTVEFHDYKKG